MPVPAFILELRRRVGHDLLLLPGLAAIVVDDAGRVLLQRRSDDGTWSPICGVLEPGEQPERAIEREVAEETGLRVRATRLVDAATSPIVQYWMNCSAHDGRQNLSLAIYSWPRFQV